MKTLRVWITLAILTITGSGCATQQVFTEPLCIDDRPDMRAIHPDEQRWLKSVNEKMFTIIAINDFLLKRHIATIERLIEEHNKQFEAECW